MEQITATIFSLFFYFSWEDSDILLQSSVPYQEFSQRALAKNGAATR
ncbi:hypothetical protein [Anaerotruncus colihominis]|nr:hypothetical protein [Anaerotruncus colihominis]